MAKTRLNHGPDCGKISAHAGTNRTINREMVQDNSAILAADH